MLTPCVHFNRNVNYGEAQLKVNKPNNDRVYLESEVAPGDKEEESSDSNLNSSQAQRAGDEEDGNNAQGLPQEGDGASNFNAYLLRSEK